MRKWLTRAALVFAVLMLLALVAALLFPQQILCVDSGPVNADVMVVLGGGAYERPQRAAKLFREHAASRILVSGFGDGEINRRLLLETGVPPDAIEMENQSRTTKENAQFAVRRLREEKFRRVIIVTSWYHSRRALVCFRHFAPEMKFYSRPSYFAFDRADWSRNEMFKRIYWEYPKLMGYWLCYGIRPF